MHNCQYHFKCWLTAADLLITQESKQIIIPLYKINTIYSIWPNDIKDKVIAGSITTNLSDYFSTLFGVYGIIIYYFCITFKFCRHFNLTINVCKMYQKESFYGHSCPIFKNYYKLLKYKIRILVKYYSLD